MLSGQGWLGLGELGQTIITAELQKVWDALRQTLTVPDVWLGLYLILAISNAMLPSTSDREAWRTVLIYLGLVLILVIALGLIPTQVFNLQDLGLTLMVYLLSTFVITITVDLLFIILIFFLEIVFGLILGRRVLYNR